MGGGGRIKTFNTIETYIYMHYESNIPCDIFKLTFGKGNIWYRIGGKVNRVSDLRKKSKREPRTYLGKKIFCRRRRREGKMRIFGEHEDWRSK